MQIPFRWAALRGRYYVHLVQMHGPFPNSVRVGAPLFAGLSLPPKVYNPGDMCVVWRPPKDAELGSKLSWQNTGPYRVLASQKHGREYRLQHLTTGDICIH